MSKTNAVTDEYGIASASTFAANSIVGAYQVEASIAELPPPIFFDVSNGTGIQTYTKIYPYTANTDSRG